MEMVVPTWAMDPFRKPKPKEEVLTLVFEPKEDMTACELATIMRLDVTIVASGGITCAPAILNKFSERVGSAYRHFRIDDSADRAKEMERKMADLVGKPVTGSLLAEIAKRLTPPRRAV